jgi:hypothetical protein
MRTGAENMKGKISISRPHSSLVEGEANSRGDYIHIRIEDEKSGVAFLDIDMSMENFAYALTQSSNIPCNLTLHDIENVGKKIETKEELVPFRSGAERYGSREERNAKLAALKPFEIDGWKGNISKVGNWHYGDSERGYLVTFTRYVEDSEDA